MSYSVFGMVWCGGVCWCCDLCFIILKNHLNNLWINQKITKFAHTLYVMEIIAFILLNSFPATSLAIEVVLLILVVVLAVLFALKAREVAALKKENLELRDTMRMMRYEEISLSRMLHTANKYVGSVGAAEENGGDEAAASEMAVGMVAVGMVEEVAADESAEEIVEESVEIPADESVVEPAEETAEGTIEEDVCFDDAAEGVVEPLVSEEDAVSFVIEETEGAAEESAGSVVIEETAEAIEPAAQEESGLVAGSGLEPAAEDALTGEPSAVVEELSAPQTHKQPINGRRPAIPVDLFSAWFAENEDASVVEEPTTASSNEFAEVKVAKSLADVVSETVPTDVPAEVSVAETFVADAEKPITEVCSVQEVGLEAAPETTAGVELSKEDERFCRKLERIVSTRLRNPNLNIDIIAAQFGIGRTNFYRKVRELMGMSPNDYLRKCRMERAAEMLRGSDLPVSDVCVQVGIPDAQYFSRVFKTHFGVTPTAYRENNIQ